jgi:uncharacterized protein YlxW (UPF0749 family)
LRKKVFGSVILVIAAGIALGLLAAVQLKNVSLAGGDVSLDRTRQLMGEMDALRAQKAELTGKLEAMEQKAADLKVDVDQSQAEIKQLQAAVDKARQEAGLTAMAGPGLVMTIKPRTYTESGKQKIIKQITDQELLMLENELNAAGAEAISINGHRLMAFSAIRLAGDYVNINQFPTSMPYEVKALGNAKTLETALRLYGGVLERFSEFYDVALKSSDSLTVPAYDGRIAFRYAKPVQ